MTRRDAQTLLLLDPLRWTASRRSLRVPGVSSAGLAPRPLARGELPTLQTEAEAASEHEVKAMPARRPAVAKVLRSAAVTGAVWAGMAAVALASGDAEGKLHLGQKVAMALESTGLPQEVILMLISAMPVVELRGGVPVGIWMGLPIWKTALLCVTGNMLPILPLLAALRLPLVRKIMSPILKRAQSKAEAFADKSTQVRGLALFVGIPLPGTGAWTGAMGAYLLDMPIKTALGAIFAGVVLAAGIMSLVTVTGTTGGIVATLALIAIFALQQKGKGAEEPPAAKE
mmetsp:Transcript_4127/g.12040  ORF Transcript_4127/g.12040 Transcript_4127/m.12040 type:complete len:286 (-) Transcript_4127:128-985(-)